MKAKKFLTMTLILAISVPCFASKIWLKRKINKSLLRSLELVTTIDADYNESSKTLALTFYESLGQIIVSVSNPQGQVVYSECVDLKSNSLLSIPMHEYSSGDYGLTITPVGEDPIEGEFYVY